VRWLAVLTLVAGCGRLGFDPLGGGIGPSECQFAPEPNDTLDDATPIAFDAPVDGLLCQTDRDVYSIDLVAGEEVAIDVERTGTGWPTIELVDADGVARAVRTYGSRLTGFANRDGRYFVRIAGVAATLGTRYSVTVSKIGGRHIFVAPTGDDSGQGTFAMPLQRFDIAIGRLVPGDTLVLLDGAYTVARNNRFAVHCSVHQSGTATAPIRVVALTDRRAHVVGDGMEDTLRMDSGCAYFAIEGLFVENVDNSAGISGSAIAMVNTSHMTVRRVLARHNNRFINSHLIEANDSSDMLVEDTEIYDFHRDGLQMFNTQRGTVRRVYVDSRDNADVSGGYTSMPTNKGDVAVAIDHSSNALVENAISVGNGSMQNVSTADIDNVDAHWFGNISLETDYGFISSIITGGAQNTIRTRYENCVAIDSTYVGFYIRSNMDAVCTRCTTIGALIDGYSADQLSVQPRTSSSRCIGNVISGAVAGV
jgi:hypothetical protein